MKTPYLLDTSTLLWALSAPDKLSKVARRAIENGELVVSVVSYWEIMLKANRNLLSISDPVAWWDRACSDLSLTALSLRPAHVSALRTLPEHHRDPFDRILIAQTIAEGLTMITSDAAIHQYPVTVVW
jgi:PIN domain nuclease of toxin-antitoxin system